MPRLPPARQEEGQPWKHPQKKRRIGRLSRDTAVFLLGLTIIVHQAFFAAKVSEPLLYISAAMVGLPAFLRLDERSKK